MSFTEILSKLGFCSQKDKQSLEKDIKQNTEILNEIRNLINTIHKQQENKILVLENKLSSIEENQQKLCLNITDRIENLSKFIDNNLSKIQDNLSNNIIEIKNAFDDNSFKQNNLIQEQILSLKEIQQKNKVYITKALTSYNDNLSKIQAHHEEKSNNILNRLSNILDNQTKQKVIIANKLDIIKKEITTANENITSLQKTLEINSLNQLKKDDLHLIEDLLRLIIANKFINDITNKKS